MNCRIEIKGLPDGEHEYQFDIDGSFFEAYESDIISDADLKVNALLSKGKGRMSMRVDINGDVTVRCDRCLADLKLPVNVSVPFSIVFSSFVEGEETDENDEVLVLDNSTAYIDLAQIIYDYVNISLPLRKVHPDGECDPEMMEKMKDILK